MKLTHTQFFETILMIAEKKSEVIADPHDLKFQRKGKTITIQCINDDVIVDMKQLQDFLK